MQKYRSHKVVEAGKIVKMTKSEEVPNTLDVYIAGYDVPERVPMHWNVHKNEGSADDMGYLVRYEDGYLSWSPSKPFEEGYTIMENEPSTASGSLSASPNIVHQHTNIKGS